MQKFDCSALSDSIKEALTRLVELNFYRIYWYIAYRIVYLLQILWSNSPFLILSCCYGIFYSSAVLARATYLYDHNINYTSQDSRAIFSFCYKFTGKRSLCVICLLVFAVYKLQATALCSMFISKIML